MMGSIDALQYLLLTIVLGYISASYIIGVLVNIFDYKFKLKPDYSHKPTVSVLMPSFNESQNAYSTIKSIRESNYPAELLQVVALDDQSKDDTFAWLQKAASDFPNVLAVRNVENKGKGLTMVDAARLASGEYIIGIDSDCIFHPNAIAELMASFSEFNIGGVGGIVKVINGTDSILARAQGIFYANSYHIFKKIENAFRKVQCLSGCVVAMRMDVFLKLSQEVASRNFLGLRITNGEDRALTQILLRNGYNTYINFDAKCWTHAPTTFDSYIKQQLRWRKSAIGQWVEAITKWRQYSPLSFGFSILPVTISLAWMSLAITSLFTLNFLSVILSILIIHICFAPVFSAIYWLANINDPYEHVDNPIPLMKALVVSAFWFPISGLLVAIFASATLDDGSWITREQA